MTLIRAIIVLLGITSWLRAQPEITGISPRGLRVGQTTIVQVEGRNLLGDPQLFVPLRPSRITLREGATAERVAFAVTLDDDAPPDIVPLRVVTDDGVSNAVLVGVDNLPQLEFAPSIDSLPVALHGTVGGGQILKTSFAAGVGDPLVVEVEARRLGSDLRPVVSVFGPNGRQLDSARSSRTLSGDARLAFQTLSSGRYLIELHDESYRGPIPGFFRLKIGDLRFADLAFPIGVRPDSPSNTSFLSSNIVEPGRSFARNIDASAWIPVAWPVNSDGHFSGRRPLVRAGDPFVPEILEQEVRTANSAIAAPVAINGQLTERAEVDTFELQVTAGKKLRCEVWSHRLGTRLDSAIAIRDSTGNQFAANDDQGDSLDPAVDFVVPEKCERIAVAVSSTADNFGPECIYRLSIEDAPTTDFSLSTSTDRITIFAGSPAVLMVDVPKRSGAPEPIQVELEPTAGSLLQARPTTIEHDSDNCLLAISAMPRTRATTTIRIIGSVAQAGVRSKLVPVVVPAIPGLPKHSPWLHEIVARIIDRPGLMVEWINSEPARLVQGVRHAVTIQVASDTLVRPGRKLRPTLVTSQRMPKKQEANQQADDPSRSLRLSDPQPFEATESSITRTLEIVVPNDLPARKWDLAVRVDLLAEDGATVLATGYSPIRRLAAEPAFLVALKSEVKPTINLSESKSLTFQGTVMRASGLDIPVRIFLTGLPTQYGVPEVGVPAGQSEFQLIVNLEKASGSGRLDNLKLESRFAGDIGPAHAEVRGTAIPIEINLLTN